MNVCRFCKAVTESLPIREFWCQDCYFRWLGEVTANPFSYGGILAPIRDDDDKDND